MARTQTGGDATAGITAHSERAARRFAAWLMQVIEPRGGWTPRRVLGRVTLALLAATSPVGLPLIVVLVLLKERHPIAHALGRGVSRLARASARAVRGRVGRAATWRAPVSGGEPARATPEIAGYRDTLRAIARAERPTRVEVLARVALLRHPDRRDAEALDYRWALEQVIRYRESGRAKAPVEVAREFARVTVPVAGMLIPLLLLIGAPTYNAISNGLGAR